MQQYHALAKLFEYPDALFPERVRGVRQHLDAYPQALESLDRFIQLLPADDLRKMQELYCRSFDVQALTTLDIGYVMFGDDYKRGELLSHLNREHVKYEIDCGNELADHLPNVLRLMAKLDDEELLNELVQEIVAPAVFKMSGEFEDRRVQQKHTAYRKHYKTLLAAPAESSPVVTLYQNALNALYTVLKADFNVVERIRADNAGDFLTSVDVENKIEESASAFY